MAAWHGVRDPRAVHQLVCTCARLCRPCISSNHTSHMFTRACVEVHVSFLCDVYINMLQKASHTIHVTFIPLSPCHQFQQLKYIPHTSCCRCLPTVLSAKTPPALPAQALGPRRTHKALEGVREKQRDIERDIERHRACCLQGLWV